MSFYEIIKPEKGGGYIVSLWTLNLKTKTPKKNIGYGNQMVWNREAIKQKQLIRVKTDIEGRANNHEKIIRPNTLKVFSIIKIIKGACDLKYKRNNMLYSVKWKSENFCKKERTNICLKFLNFKQFIRRNRFLTNGIKLLDINLEQRHLVQYYLVLIILQIKFQFFPKKVHTFLLFDSIIEGR